MAQSRAAPDAGIGAGQVKRNEAHLASSHSSDEQGTQESAVNLEATNLGFVALTLPHE